MANYYFTLPDSVTLPTDGNKVSLTTACELHRDDSAVPNALTVVADSYNVFLADAPGTGTATAPDATAPVLSSPTGAENGATGATTLGVSTDEGNGTLYWGIYPTASTPSAADVVAGTGATVNGSQAVSGTGAQAVSDQTGLTASTAYKAHYVQDDAAANRSNLATSAEFTTDAAAPSVLFYDDFTPDVASLEDSADYTWVLGGADDMEASGGQASSVSGSTTGVKANVSPAANCYAKITIGTVGAGGIAAIYIRATDASDGYRVYIQPTAFRLQRIDGGALTQLGSTQFTAPLAADTFEIRASGSTISVLHKGSTPISVTDATHASAGDVTMLLSSDWGIDDLEVGNL